MSHFKAAVEVFEKEGAALKLALQKIKPDFDKLVDMLLAMEGKLIVVGVGKSGSIGQKISATLSSTGTPAAFINGSEALHGDLGIITCQDIVMMISNSGSTVELVEMVPSLETIGANLVGILGNVAAPLARKCSVALNAGVEEEACPLNLAPMSSTTVSLVIGDALAAALMKARHFKPKDFALRHPGGFLGKRLLLKVENLMHTRKEVPCVAEAATLKDMLLASTHPNLGIICVTDKQGELKGIVTDGDIRRLLLKDACFETLRAKDCMITSPISIAPQASIDEALRLMEQHKIYNLIVTDKANVLCGVLGTHSILSGKGPLS